LWGEKEREAQRESEREMSKLLKAENAEERERKTFQRSAIVKHTPLREFAVGVLFLGFALGWDWAWPPGCHSVLHG